MAKVRFELNREGVAELMKSDAMQRILREKAKQVESAAGEGFQMEEQIGKFRAVARVRANSYAARRKNSHENTLLKALGAGR